MTTQDSGAPPIDANEAERLASMIRPAWEVDEVDNDEPVAVQAKSIRETTQGISPQEASAITARLSGGTDPGAAPPRDTVIDGAPMVGVGRTDPGPEATPELRPIVDSAPPRPAGPTKMGLGEDVADALAQVDGARSGSTRAEAAEVTEALAVGPTLRNGGIKRTDVMEAPALPPVRPQPASFSRADDPIEIPVKKSSDAILIGVGLAAAVAAVVGGVLLFGGSEHGDRRDTKKSDSATDSKTSEAKPTAKPAETAVASAAPVVSVAVAASASASESATAATSAAPSAEPVAKVDPPKVETTSKPTAKPNPPTGTAKPPPKTGGGIIRDTPF